jgi:glyoxylase-like metal-dependent hydrolase (beta-lactamase superfamily II)
MRKSDQGIRDVDSDSAYIEATPSRFALGDAISTELTNLALPIDLEFRGRPRYIASCLLASENEIAIVDPGPSHSVDVLRRKLADVGVSISDVTTILLTHIHLDHAGVTGTLVAENPIIRVFVHERGAAHLVEPTRLLQSAASVFGAKGDEYWGAVEAVPTENVNVLRGGEQLELGSRKFEVLYTPGHAKHHVSYFERERGIAFVGDALGIRTNDFFVYPATPPPDVDLERLQASADLIESCKPKRLFLTHFGLMGEVEWHLADFRKRLGRWSEFVRQSLEQPGEDEARAKLFSEMAAVEAASLLKENETDWFKNSVSSRQNWYGLARYWRRLEASMAKDKAD